MKKANILIIGIVSFLFLSGCGVAKKVWNGNEETEAILFTPVKAQELEGTMKHPATLETSYIQKVLSLLRFKSFDGTENIVNIFSQKDYSVLTQKIKQEFGALKDDEKVKFQYLGATGRTTKGETFIDKNGYWNWKFKIINGSKPENSWEIVAGNIFQYKTMGTLLEGVIVKKNWVMVSEASIPEKLNSVVNTPKENKEEKENQVIQKSNSEEQLKGIKDINQRLRFLKELRDSGYITEKDYLNQKQKLLNRL
ncbi:MAG: SHOCT domain-containing protein [Nitrospinae bacterium]|nr:SHOCT domain-containing protein [Nitrospinota bacterium]